MLLKEQRHLKNRPGEEFYFMITLSLNFDKAANSANRGAHEKQIRDIVDTHLAFPGSDKLKMGVTIRNNGAASVSFTGPKEAIAEAKRLWRENVKPAAKKVKRAAVRAAKPAKKPSKSAASKRTKGWTKAKASRKVAKKRKA
jgi:hypothetical protein